MWGFPGGSDSKESTCNAGDLGLIPGLGRSPGEGNGCPLQYSCLENFMNKEAWRAIGHGIAESDMTEQLTHTHNDICPSLWHHTDHFHCPKYPLCFTSVFLPTIQPLITSVFTVSVVLPFPELCCWSYTIYNLLRLASFS